ncbi:hypothetical protein DPMN_053016 [Dreissena polymorpha]|uniref:Uncharacterized protein n=1 Tax=Dreissena polymorpha TaxID=45954 RepID=A0A9D4HPU0_DREPO|nr:hypothetical protein DPMN_053016 [Dreissena polymorpha]
MRVMSSANLKSELGLQLMEMESLWSWSVSRIIFSRKMLNRTEESRQLRLTPADVLKKSPICPFRSNALLAFPFSS